MKRILCTSIALMVLLSMCSAPSREPIGGFTHGMYEFRFTVERLSGWPFEGWDFVYTYDGEEIKTGDRILFSLEIFSFYYIQADVIERDTPDNIYSTTFPVAICDGGSGKTEITVTDSDGRTATFQITCRVTQVGKR